MNFKKLKNAFADLKENTIDICTRILNKTKGGKNESNFYEKITISLRHEIEVITGWSKNSDTILKHHKILNR